MSQFLIYRMGMRIITTTVMLSTRHVNGESKQDDTYKALAQYGLIINNVIVVVVILI